MLLEDIGFVVICYTTTENKYIYYTSFTMNFKSMVFEASLKVK